MQSCRNRDGCHHEVYNQKFKIFKLNLSVCLELRSVQKINNIKKFNTSHWGYTTVVDRKF